MSGNIMAYNGGAIIAMAGKDCVGIASDLRYGIQAQTVATDFPKVYQMDDHLFLGLAGLATDVQTLYEKFKFRLNLFKLREERHMKPASFAKLVSNVLYERRFGPFFVEPVVAGLDPATNKPYLCAMDLIGAPVFTDDFVVSGTCTEQMYGVCESMYKADLEPDDLFEVLGQCLLSAVDRDCVSGWGGVVYIITKDKVVKRTLKGRQD